MQGGMGQVPDALGQYYIEANAKAKAKISLIIAAPQYKHTTRKYMYPFQTMSLSLQYKRTTRKSMYPFQAMSLRVCFNINAP